jgi:hypothetical protein
MRRVLSIFAASLAGLLAIAAWGCGGSDDATPVACLDGPEAYVSALDDAPGAVRLSGEVPISDCLATSQEGGELATVGLSMVNATTKLNTEARGDPGGAANLQLGYLLGAAETGAGQTGGIHAELVRRLRAAALYRPGDRALSPRFMRTYREGFDAGHENG